MYLDQSPLAPYVFFFCVVPKLRGVFPWLTVAPHGGRSGVGGGEAHHECATVTAHFVQLRSGFHGGTISIHVIDPYNKKIHSRLFGLGKTSGSLPFAPRCAAFLLRRERERKGVSGRGRSTFLKCVPRPEPALGLPPGPMPLGDLD